MHDFVASLLSEVRAKNPGEPEFHQAVQEVVESLVKAAPLLDAIAAPLEQASAAVGAPRR